MRDKLYIFVQNNCIGDTVYFISGGTYDFPAISAAEFDYLIKMVIDRSAGVKVCFPLISRTKLWNDIWAHVTILSSNGVSIH